MTDKLFEAALGVSPPWQVTGAGLRFGGQDAHHQVDIAGSRFALAGVEGQHPVRHRRAKRYRLPELLPARVRSRECVSPR